MISVLLVRSVSDRGLAGQLALDLTRRGFQTSEVEPGSADATARSVARASPVRVLVLPHEDLSATNYDHTLGYLRRLVEADDPAVVLARDDDEIPDWALTGQLAVIRTTAEGLYDKVFEDLFRILLGPLPVGVDIVVRPSVIQSPVGVAWWLNDLFVSDDGFGHVVRLDGRRSTVVIPGLDDPQQLTLDRTKLLVANKGADQILRADLKQGGSVTHIEPLSHNGVSALSRPTSVHQAAGRTVIADTDNHRIVATSDDPWISEAEWRAFGESADLRYPCGVHVGSSHLWVADTFNGRLFTSGPPESGQELVQIPLPASGTAIHPVAVTTNVTGDLIIVSDEHGKRVLFFRLDPKGAGQESLEHLIEFGSRAAPAGGSAVPVGTPGGLSVNRDNRLAVADRQLACVWLLHLDLIEDLTVDVNPANGSDSVSG